MQDNKIVIVNHGKQFGIAQWCTFHCPKCSNNLGTNKEQEYSSCGTLLKNMEDLKINEELLSEALGYEVDTFLGITKNEIDYTCRRATDIGYEDISINIYEFAFSNLKQWAKLRNVFDIIDWSEEPEQIFKKAEKIRNEIN